MDLTLARLAFSKKSRYSYLNEQCVTRSAASQQPSYLSLLLSYLLKTGCRAAWAGLCP